MKEDVLREVFSVYEILKDSMKVTRRSIAKDVFNLHSRTIFLYEQKGKMLEKLSESEEELEHIMILSLFASFERELRVSIQNIIDNNVNKCNSTVDKLATLAKSSIERWSVQDMVEAFSDVVDLSLRSTIKQIYEYRNWVAHGKNPNKLPAIRTDPKTVLISLVDFILQAKQAMQNSQNVNCGVLELGVRPEISE